jgi:hypothetical protein
MRARQLLPLLASALLGVGVLAGCGGGEEESVAAAIAHSGLLGGFGEQLKREDDEAEVAELRASEPRTPEERAEAREAAEEESAEAAEPAETASSADFEGEEESSGGE